MTAALFGLLGVIVGGVLNGVVAQVIARRQEAAGGRVAARLVGHELGLLCGEFEHMQKFGVAAGLVPVPIRTPEWDQHRTTLAGVLSDEAWEVVQAGYTWVALYNSAPPHDRYSDPRDALDPDDAELYLDVVSEMSAGVEVLHGYVTGRREPWSPSMLPTAPGPEAGL